MTALKRGKFQRSNCQTPKKPKMKTPRVISSFSELSEFLWRLEFWNLAFSR